MPFYRYTVQVALSPEEVVANIGAITRSRGFLARLKDLNQPFDGPVAAFVGCVGQASFRLRPNVRLVSRPVSVVTGKVQPADTGASLTVTVRLPLPLLVVLVVLVGIVARALWVHAMTFTEALIAAGIVALWSGFFPFDVLNTKRKLASALSHPRRPRT